MASRLAQEAADYPAERASCPDHTKRRLMGCQAALNMPVLMTAFWLYWASPVNKEPSGVAPWKRSSFDDPYWPLVTSPNSLHHPLATGDTCGTVTSGTCAILFGYQASGRELFPGLKRLREVRHGVNGGGDPAFRLAVPHLGRAVPHTCPPQEQDLLYPAALYPAT